MGTLEIYVDGRPLSSIGPWDSPVVSHRWPYGSWELTWSQPLNPRQRPQQLKADKLVEARVGPVPIWVGQLAEPNWEDGTFAAVGAARQGEETLCFDGSGVLTSVIDIAIDQAIAMGAVDWSRPVSIAAVPYGGATTSNIPNYLTALMDAAFKDVPGWRWYVDNARAVRSAPDPTVPTAMLRPDVGVWGVADAAKVGTVFGRYMSSTTGLPATASYGSGRPHLGVSYLARGPITGVDATSRCQAIWTDLQGKTGWTNGLTVQSGDLRNLGGARKELWTFRAGPAGMARLLGVRDERALLMNTDGIAGETIWRPDDDTLQINPVGMAARDEASILEARGGVKL